MRHLCAAAVFVMLVLGALSPPLSVGQPSALVQAPGSAGSGTQLYMGVGACSAPQCHGRVAPWNESGIPIRQNEHLHWFRMDRHARAYAVLAKPRSQQIAKNLKLPEEPSQSARCLVCHAMYVPKALQGERYQLEDGVSCEACHGPSSAWLGKHANRNPNYAELLQLGMYDTRHLVKRAEKCVSCHVGDETRNVDHELIAAGHPDLVFELDTYTASLTPHWRRPPGEEAGTWAVGQAVALREGLKRLARRTQQRAAPAWPEFAEFECFTCHHEVKNVKSTYYSRGPERRLQSGAEWPTGWREARGYTGVAGIPPWNPARYFIFRQLVQAIAPAEWQTLEQELNNVSALMAQVGANDPAQITAAAHRAAQAVDSLLARGVIKQEIDQELAGAVLRHITGDSTAIAGSGVRVAGQAAMAIQTFVLVAQKQGKPLAKEPVVTDAIEQLFQALDRPEAYDPQQFATQMRALHSFLTQQ